LKLTTQLSQDYDKKPTAAMLGGSNRFSSICKTRPQAVKSKRREKNK